MNRLLKNKKYYWFLSIVFVFGFFIYKLAILPVKANTDFVPLSNSFLAKGEHPRIHITPDSLVIIRQEIANNPVLKTKYQEYVDYVASASSDKKDVISNADHDVLRALMLQQALVANIGYVNGVNLPITPDEYARRAIASLSSALNSKQTLSYVGALVYDWTYNFMTADERSDLASMMVDKKLTHKVFSHTVANPTVVPQQLFSSKYYEGFLAYYAGLALYGERSEANGAVNSFYDVMLNDGYLDAQNFAGQGGGWTEWIGYASWHPRFLLLDMDAWRTATGEDYIGNKNIIKQTRQPSVRFKEYASFLHYAVDPHRYVSESNSSKEYNEFTFIKTGSAETTDTRVNHGEKQRELYFLTGVLQSSGLSTAAGLVRDFIERYEVDMPSYNPNRIWLFMNPYTQAKSKSPESLNLPHSRWLKNIGTFIARTGFTSSADGVFTVNDSHYRFSGHDGPDDFPGFTLNKFGTLVNTRNVAHRGYGNLDSYPGAFRNNVIDFGVSERYKDFSSQAEYKQMLNNDPSYDLGGIEQVTVLDKKLYAVRSDRTRAFKNGIKHTRDYVYLPGINPASDSDFLVIYDRAKTPSAQKPSWVYHVPWKPTAINYDNSTDLTTGSGTSDRIGTRFTGSNIIIEEHNGLGGEKDGEDFNKDYTGGANAHGVLFAKTLLPKQADVEVTRVAQFDNQVKKRQHYLAIKATRWQVAVKPINSATDNTYLNVMQVADENNETSMVPTEYIDAGIMEGAFFQGESSGRPNSVVLFNKSETAQQGQFVYTISSNGLTRHVITGLKPNTQYTVVDDKNNSFIVNTISNVDRWDYNGNDTVDNTGTLYFETTLTGTHQFTISPAGDVVNDCVNPSCSADNSDDQSSQTDTGSSNNNTNVNNNTSQNNTYNNQQGSSSSNNNTDNSIVYVDNTKSKVNLPNFVSLRQDNDLGIIISWVNPVDDDFSYIKIYRSEKPQQLGKLIADNITTEFFVDKDVENNTRYYYTIRSVDVFGNESANVYTGGGIVYNKVNSVNYRKKQIDNIISDAVYIITNKFDSIINLIAKKFNLQTENFIKNKYLKKIKASDLESEYQDKIIKFISYGTRESLALGEGERAGVINSFREAFGRLPKTQKDWEDVMKIGSGRWPEQRSELAEQRARLVFSEVYLRQPDMSNPNDAAAVVIMSYGLRSDNRNLDSEKVALNIFKKIYNRLAQSAVDWDIVRAIAYSGATR